MRSSAFVELAGLSVTVDEVSHAPGHEAPQERPYAFSYRITIRNDSSSSVTIRARKWVLTDALHQQRVIECDGVYGKFPVLAPGDSFSLRQYHCIATTSRAEGAFFGVTECGTHVFTPIPVFEMRLPGE